MNTLKSFHEFRSRMNARIEEEGSLQVKRFLSLDSQAYRDGALDEKTKELLGFVASAVLRCDDCITYHLENVVHAGVTDEELWEVLNIVLVVGGSITIPHIRRALHRLDEIRGSEAI